MSLHETAQLLGKRGITPVGIDFFVDSALKLLQLLEKAECFPLHLLKSFAILRPVPSQSAVVSEYSTVLPG